MANGFANDCKRDVSICAESKPLLFGPRRTQTYLPVSTMAAEAPDPKTFESWEEAFQYPIPAVRGMERMLRRDIDSNREKLRTLVG